MNDRIDEQFCKSKIAALPVLRTWPGNCCVSAMSGMSALFAFMDLETVLLQRMAGKRAATAASRDGVGCRLWAVSVKFNCTVLKAGPI